MSMASMMVDSLSRRAGRGGNCRAESLHPTVFDLLCREMRMLGDEVLLLSLEKGREGINLIAKRRHRVRWM